MDALTSQSYLADHQIITEVSWPVFLTGPNLERGVEAALLLGQLTDGRLGIAYEGPEQIIRLDFPRVPWEYDVPAREIVPALFGTVPVILAPTDSATVGQPFSGGVWWERASLEMGWYTTDWPGENGSYPILDMPAGPQFGQGFLPPNWELADILFALGYFN